MNIKKSQRVVSGITATGNLTIGNYIGAIRNFVQLQDKYEMFIFVADLHAITIKIKPQILRENIRRIMTLYLACGLNSDKVKLFVQSDILEHANLGHILLSQTTVGELSRMTQYKQKSFQHAANGTEFVPTGILTYPTLMSADILLYDPDYVPVGEDQKQHIELTRNIANRFNNYYGPIFKIPEPLISQQGSRIMSLTDPRKKMSKSSSVEKSFISLLDDPKKAYKKIMSAVTDSENRVYFDPVNKPGISNLITIGSCFQDVTIEKMISMSKDLNYGEFKQKVAKLVVSFLENLQKKFLLAEKETEKIRYQNAEIVRPLAAAKLKKIKAKMGFL